MAFDIDVYVRADGTATTVATATDPSSASTSYSLTTLEADKANTAGLIVGLSSQGGNFTTAPGNGAAVDCCISMQDGTTYTNVAGEDVVIDIQDVVGTDPAIFNADDIDTGYVSKNDTGSISLTGSGDGDVVSTSGTAGAAGDGFGIVVTNVDVVSNHLSDNSAADDCYDAKETSELKIVGGSVSDIIATGALTAAVQVFTAHDSAKIQASGVTVNNVSQLTANTNTSTCALSDMTVTDWELDLVSVLGTGLITVTNSTLVNDGSARALSAGGFFSGTNGVAGFATFRNCNITFDIANKQRFMYDAEVSFIDCNVTYASGAYAQVQCGTTSADTGKLIIQGGTWTNNHTTAMFRFEGPTIEWDRVLFSHPAVGTGGLIAQFNEAQNVTNTSHVRSCVFHHVVSGNNYIFRFLVGSDFPLEFQNNTVYGQGATFDTTTGATGLVCENNTFVGNGVSNLVFDSLYESEGTTATWDNNHYRNVNRTLADSNEVGAGADPGFNDPASGDFTIPRSSILSGAGKVVGVDRDYANKPFNRTPSVGAYEVPRDRSGRRMRRFVEIDKKLIEVFSDEHAAELLRKENDR